MVHRLSLRLRVFLFFALVAIGGVAAVIGALWLGYRRLGEPWALSAFVTSGIVAAFVILGLVAWVWTLFDQNVAKAVEKLATDMRARAHAGVEADLDHDLARYLGDLAPAASAVTARFLDMKNNVAEAVGRETAQLSMNNTYLEAILSDLAEAVVVCTHDHHAVFFNSAARLHFGDAVGLDRSMADHFCAQSLESAYAAMVAGHAAPRMTITVGDQDRPVRMQLLKPLPETEAEPAYVLNFSVGDARHDLTQSGEVVYDFDLLHARPSRDLAQARLADLTFVVFDTETTGLMPERGDEVCQIAAFRVTKGKLRPSEKFDTLVNPGRHIPLASTNVHGITDEMVADAPDFVTVGKRFHQFSENAVLVAHNAPFDMAFLYKHQDAMGVRFDHPILDTVLLSAVVYGQTEQHSLDALADRLQVTIPDEDRHTARGDAMATADILTKLIPMLNARGIDTFQDLVTETRKHRRLIADMN